MKIHYTDTARYNEIHAFFVRKLVMLLVLDFLKTFLNLRAVLCRFDGEEENNILE